MIKFTEIWAANCLHTIDIWTYVIVECIYDVSKVVCSNELNEETTATIRLRSMAIVNHLHHTPNAINKRQFFLCVCESTISQTTYAIITQVNGTNRKNVSRSQITQIKNVFISFKNKIFLFSFTMKSKLFMPVHAAAIHRRSIDDLFCSSSSSFVSALILMKIM